MARAGWLAVGVVMAMVASPFAVRSGPAWSANAGSSAAAAPRVPVIALDSAPMAAQPPASLQERGPKVVLPTNGGTGARPAASRIAAAAPNQLTFGGGVDGIGVDVGTPRVYLVFWGSQWGTASTGTDGFLHLSGDTMSIAPRLQAVLSGLGTSSVTWSGVATQYCEGVAIGATTCPIVAPHVPMPTAGVLAGVAFDNSVAAPAQAADLDIGVEGYVAANGFGNVTPASNRNAQYIVLSPPGTHPGGFLTTGQSFCAWHAAVTTPHGDLAFVNLPYLTDAGTGCGRNYVNVGTAGLLDGVSIVGGHEYAEAITDPIPGGGWFDAGGEEVADKCAWIGIGGAGGAQNVTLQTGSFAMQGLWSNDAASCQISHPVVTTQFAVTAVGSPTTERLMDSVLSGPYQFSVHSQQAPTLLAAGDTQCADVSYNQVQAPGTVAAAPDSGTGRDALRGSAAGTYPDPSTDAGRGCVDIARSGSDPRAVGPTGDSTSFDYYAMALDAVSWATPSLSAPAALTLDQLRRIFDCQITDWSQLAGGASGPIQRVMPPSASDTAAAFVTRVLGFDPALVSGPACPAVLTIAAEHGDYLTDAAHGGRSAAYQQMILPYSAGTWAFQTTNAANPSLDPRNGVRIGAVVTTPGDERTATYPVWWSGSRFFLNNRNNVVSEANPNLGNPADASVFPGVHYLYNVVDTTSPGYATARGLVGFDASTGGTAKSALCSGLESTDILSAGFLSLPAQTQPNGSAGVTCRLKTP
jgi:hypothetical protein